MRTLLIAIIGISMSFGCSAGSTDQGALAPGPTDGGLPDALDYAHDGHAHQHQADDGLADVLATTAQQTEDGGSDGASEGSAPTPDAEQDGSEVEAPCTTIVMLLDYELSPADVVLPAGHHVVCAQNGGKAPHDLVLFALQAEHQRAEVGRTPILAPGEHARIALDLPRGVFEMICSRPGHESLGMRGTLHID